MRSFLVHEHYQQIISKKETQGRLILSLTSLQLNIMHKPASYANSITPTLKHALCRS